VVPRPPITKAVAAQQPVAKPVTPVAQHVVPLAARRVVLLIVARRAVRRNVVPLAVLPSAARTNPVA